MSELQTAEKNLDLVNKMVEVSFKLETLLSELPSGTQVQRTIMSDLDIALTKFGNIRVKLLPLLSGLKAYALLAQNECKNAVAAVREETVEEPTEFKPWYIYHSEQKRWLVGTLGDRPQWASKERALNFATKESASKYLKATLGYHNFILQVVQ